MNSNNDLQNLLLISNTVKKRILEKPTNNIPLKKSKKEINVIWTRVSTQNQAYTLSLQQQQKICEWHLKTNNMTNIDTVVYNIVGSGYKIKKNVQIYLDKLNEYLENNYEINLICYMSDRFLRNFSIASNCINNIVNHNGSIHIVRDINNKNIIVNNINNINIIQDSLLTAENESKIKSQRMKDIFKTKFNNNIRSSYSDETFKNIIKFINIFIHGGPVKTINLYFTDCIDWESHPNWIEDYYVNPIQYNESNITYFTKSSNEDDTDNRIKSIVSLFNDYKINIPENFKPKTKWDSKFIKKILEYFY